MIIICFYFNTNCHEFPRIIMNFIYYPDGGHRTRIIIWKFVDNYMAIICFNLTRIAMNSPRIIMNFIYYPDGLN